MTWAADAAGHPDPRALRDADCAFVGQYVGTVYQHFGVQRWYIDQCHALGIGVLLILEEWASQFLGGYATARQMMLRMEEGWHELGVPDDGSVIPAIAVVDPNPGAVYGHEGELSAFVRGIEDSLWTPEWTGYGSKYGLTIASGVAKKMTRRWGVGTWGYEEGPAPVGALPPDTDQHADLIQHGNREAPVEDVDYNTIFRPDMGQWADATTSIPAKEEQDVAYIAVGDALAGRMAAVVDGGYRVGDLFTGPAGGFGIPQSAIDWNAKAGRGLRYVFLDGDPDRFAHVIAERPVGGGNGEPCPPCPPALHEVTSGELIAELTARLT